MKTVTIKIETMKDFADNVMSSMNAAATGERGAGDGVISFPSWAVMHKVMAPNRMAVIQAMAGRGELTIREIAALVGRDVKGVHTDVTALINAGLLERGESGTQFPYDAIHFDFTISAAA
ncbi:glycosyl transferase family 1 [Enterobacteriaceae bacterium 89]|nr:glycosyl transferase family 1 [Enterobacteriaceae bacterium 89]